MPSIPSLSIVVLATALGSSGCNSSWETEEGQCYDPLIYSLTASPQEAYTSDSVVISTYLHNSCASVPVLTFPDYDSSVVSSFPGYESPITGLDGVEGILLQRADAEVLFYETEPLPLTSFSPGYLRYSLAVYGGLATLEKIDSLDNYLKLLVADTGE